MSGSMRRDISGPRFRWRSCSEKAQSSCVMINESSFIEVKTSSMPQCPGNFSSLFYCL
jgi:hypothetical protein